VIEREQMEKALGEFEAFLRETHDEAFGSKDTKQTLAEIYKEAANACGITDPAYASLARRLARYEQARMNPLDVFFGMVIGLMAGQHSERVTRAERVAQAFPGLRFNDAG
jgi:hypothetical protein